jgi:adenylate cyclase class IV
VPKYNLQNKAVEPPLVALRLSNEIFIKGVVSGSIGITYSKPILSNGKYAKIELSITISEVDPYDATSVFKNGGFRGVVSSLKSRMNIGEY